MQELRERLEEYRAACERERWRLSRTPDPSSLLAELDDRFADLASGEPLEELRRESAGPGEAAQARARLALGIEDAVVAARTRRIEAELRTAVRNQRVRAGSFEGNERALRARLGVALDADERARLCDALVRAHAELEALRVERCVAVGAARGALGHTDGVSFLAARSPGLEAEAIDQLADRVLERSDAVFRDVWARVVRTPDPALAELAHARRAPALDQLLAAAQHRPALAECVAALGRPIGELAGVTLESGPRADRFAFEVPGDVRLVLPTASGLRARASAFEAAGRALHAAYTSSELPVERRRVVDPALETGFGLLVGLRALDPLWLAERDAGPAGDALAAHSRFEHLLGLRSAAALARVELELARVPAGSQPPADLGPRFASELERAGGARPPESAALACASPEGRSIARLQGYALEALLGERLRSAHGRRFWREPRAWNLLKELWNTGATYHASRLAAELGFDGLDPTPLLDACAVP